MLKVFDNPRQLTLYHHNIVHSALSLNVAISTDIFSFFVSVKNRHSESEFLAQLQRLMSSKFVKLTTGYQPHTSDVDNHPNLFLASF
jgi:hypothetical protein